MLKKNGIFYFLCFLIFLTSSFDVFLTFDIGGYTFRFCQIISLIMMIFAFAKLTETKIIRNPVGFKYFLLWLAFLALCTFNTEIVSMNFSYHLWLIFNMVMVFTLVNIFSTEYDLKKVIKLYLLSFVSISLFGIIQFVLPFLGYGNPPFITQWWTRGVLVRVNGFSYEPSYFATYLIIGWSMFRVLLINRKSFMNSDRFKILLGFLIITVAMILSTSRIGIMIMILFEISNLLYSIYFIYNKKGKINAVLRNLIITFILIFLAGISIIYINDNIYDLSFLLNGTGLFGSSSHSYTERFDGIIDTLTVFSKSPLLGYGLGGVYEAVAKLNSIDIYSGSLQDISGTLCVFAEVLAASGIIGFVSFISYIISLIVKPIKLSIKKLDAKEKILINTIVISFVVELITLQFNQNILRTYLWIHIGVLSLFYSVYYRKYVNNEKDINS